MGLLSKLKKTATSSSQDKKSNGPSIEQAGPSGAAAINGDGHHASSEAAGRRSFADDVTGANRADMHGEVYHGDFHHHQQQYGPSNGASLSTPLASTKPASNGGLFGKLKSKASNAAVVSSARSTASRSGSGNDAQRLLQPSASLRGQPYNALNVQDAIGRFCGMRDEDWTGMLELADVLSTSDAYSKDAAECLRKEFKHGVPQAQERAAKLLVVLWRNTTDRFRLKIADKKFTKQLEQTIKSHNTESPVRKTLYKAVAVLAWESHGDRDMNSILQVYQSVKPAEAPADGIPIDEADNTFNPISFSKQPLRTRRNQQYDPDRQMDQNIHRAKVARSEAAMLSETLAYTSAETVESNDIVKEYYPKITNWQQWISNEMPWAQAESDRVHREQNQAVAADGRAVADNEAKKPSKQEELLDLLLSANSEIIDALATYQRLHDQAHRAHREEADLRMAQERSMSENRYNAEQDAVTNGVKNLQVSSAAMQPVASTSSSNEGAAIPKIAHVYAEDEDLDSDKVIRHDLRVEDDALVRKPSGSSPPPLRIQSHNPYQRYSKGAQELSPMAFSPLNGALVSEPSAVEPSPLVSKNPFYSQPTFDANGNRRATGDSIEDAGVPKAPSAKALGKLRRFSGPRSAIDTETQQRRLEDQMRQRYEHNYIEDQHKREGSAGVMPSEGDQQGHRRQQSQASQQSAASMQHQAILEEYDPIR